MMNSKSLRKRRPVFADGSLQQNNSYFPEDFVPKKCTSMMTQRVWIYIFFLYFSIFLVVLYSDVIRFPNPVSVKNLRKSGYPRELQFSEERARNFVTELASIGPKPTGSYECEVLAVDYLVRQLNFIKAQAKPVHTIEIDIQKCSGCFPLTFQDKMVSCYANVKNIVARISPLKPTNRSLLVNCHFDTVPSSPGASDDLVSCAVMLETLLSLSQREQSLPNDVIFLFNSAEENVLQAAHGFITQHRWAKTVVGFVNMEACGAGGKQMLFQADRERTWLLQAYAKGAPYPQGSVLAQDIFQNGLIPSDTDYRIFEHFGNLPGLDFAYVKNGYAYHTTNDLPQAINHGAIQQAGLNLLNLLNNALGSPEMRDVKDQTKLELVFFDFLGIFMIVYQVTTATVINLIVVILSFIDMYLKFKKSGIPLKARALMTIKAFGVTILSLVVALVFCAIIAVVLDVFNATMSWYRSPYLIAGLYGSSSVAALIYVHNRFAEKVESLREKWMREEVYFDAARLFWIFILCAMELSRFNSSFVCCAWVIFPTVIRGAVGNFFELVGKRSSYRSHLLVHLSMHVIPLSFLLYCVWSMYTVFVPIVGRIGTMLNPEFLIGVFTAIFVFMSMSYMLTLIQVISSSRKVVLVLMFVFGVTFSLICFTPVGFPYSGEGNDYPTPMRLYVLHTARAIHDKNGSIVSEDSGYWIVPLDYNGPQILKNVIPLLEEASPLDCDVELACGMPFLLPVISLLRLNYYVPASKPKIPGTRKFELISNTLINSYTHRLTFTANGPDHMTVILSPRKGVELKSWSLTEETPLRSVDWRDRPSYFIFYSYGEFKQPWTFYIDFEVTKEHIKGTPLIDLNFITHYLHGHDMVTGDFPTLLKTIPPYIHATPWTSTVDIFVF